MIGPIEGMGSVVTSVSGYHGTERFNLIQLITQTGASYVGNMTPSITHLVCWKFEGKKYDLAKKFRITVVNHGWVTECLKQGKRVPERPFTLQSGQELGPLSLEVPVISMSGASPKRREVLKDRSNMSDPSEVSGKSWGGEGSSLSVWTDSILLNENKFPEFRQRNNNAHRSKPKSLKRSSKLGDRSNSRYREEPPLSGFIEMEREETNLCPSRHSMKGKRKLFEHGDSSNRTNLKENRKNSETNGCNSRDKASHKGWKLVKKNTGKEVLNPVNLDSVNLDSDGESNPIRTYSCHDNVAALSHSSDSEETSVDEFIKYSRAINLGFDDIEEIEDWNSLLASKANSHAKCTQSGPPKSKKKNSSVVKNSDKKIKDTDQSELKDRLPSSMELSCVICLTEFSSTRGILPCGHRFCYSCIRTWSDQMISKGQISTCPLCKGPFMSITKVNDAATTDQKIYSQTIPCTTSMKNIMILTEPNLNSQSRLAPTCSECRSREPVDLLIYCHLCQIRCIHSYCLDPPLFPWTCTHCKDLQMIYHRAR